jgi:hypothetical protein
VRCASEIRARDKNMSFVTKKNSIVTCPFQVRLHDVDVATKRAFADLRWRDARRAHCCAVNQATIPGFS